MSSMLDTGPRLSSEARLRCSSRPPERTGEDALMSTEPMLFLPLVSLSRPILEERKLFNQLVNKSKAVAAKAGKDL